MSAIVTGAGGGIGRAIALKLAEDGHAVAALDLDARAARETTRLIAEAGNRGQAFVCDVARPAAVARAYKRVTSALGRVDILVNNAGVGGPFHRVDEVSLDEWDWIMGVNLKSVFLLARLALPEMRKARFGRVINIASIQGLLGSARSSTYVASKHAMVGYTRALAAEWGGYGITCNAICPGYVDTRMGAQKKFAARAAIEKRTPTGRLARPAEIASLASWVAGPDAGYLNGAILAHDGGISAAVGL